MDVVEKPARTKRPLHLRVLIWMAGSLVVVFLLILGFLKSDLTLDWRQDLGAELAKQMLGMEAKIDGDVHFDLFPEFSALIKDLKFSFVPGTEPDDFDQAIGLMSVTLPYALLLGADGPISEIRLADTQLSFETSDASQKGSSSTESQQSAPFMARLPSILLGRNFVKEISLTDMNFNLTDPVGGWDQMVEMEGIQWNASDPAEITSSISGKVNNVSISTTLEVLGEGQERSLVMTGELPGLSLKVDGTIDPSDSVSDIDVAITAKSESLRELASILEIRADFEGDAEASLRLTGLLTRLDLTELDVRVATPKLPKVTLAGQALDLSAPKDVRLEFDADLEFTDPSAAPAKPTLLEFDIEGVSGVLTGQAGELRLENGTVRTNLATVAGDTIGPISIGRVVKDENNTVGLEDVKAQYGPSDRPRAVISGSIADVLNLSGLDLSGVINIPVSELLDDLVTGKAGDLGVLEGTVSVSNASGPIKITDLNASVVGNDLINLTIKMPEGGGETSSGHSMGVKLAVSDLRELADTLGNTVDNGGPMAFDGTVKIANSAAKIDADLSFLSSDLTLDIETRTEDAKAVIDGSVKSSALSTDDLAVLVDTVHNRSPKPERDGEDSSGHVSAEADIWSLFKAKIAFDIAKLLDGSQAAGDLSGELTYADKKFDLSSFSVAYLGGTITGDYGLDLTGEPLAVRAKGKIEKWQLGSILSDFMAAVPVTGTLYLSYDIRTSGRTVTQMAKSMSGSFRASLWSGSVQTRLLDLTGLNLVTWMFGKGSQQKNSKLVCAVLPLEFKNGAASGNAMVVETENVQIVGGGSFSLRDKTLNLSFVPRAKAQQAIEIVSPFSISGTFSSPQLKLKTPAAARAIGETLALPFNLLGQVVTKGAAKPNVGKPCRPAKK